MPTSTKMFVILYVVVLFFFSKCSAHFPPLDWVTNTDCTSSQVSAVCAIECGRVGKRNRC